MSRPVASNKVRNGSGADSRLRVGSGRWPCQAPAGITWPEMTAQKVTGSPEG